MMALSILAKVTVLVGLGLLITHVAVRARASVRHLVLAATFMAIVAIPAWIVAAPALTLDVPVALSVAARVVPASLTLPAPGTSDRMAPAPTPVERSTTTDWRLLLARSAYLLWFLGTAAVFAPAFALVWRLRYLRRTSVPNLEMTALARAIAAEIGVRRSVPVVQHDELPAPITSGVLRPVILMPMRVSSWSADDVRRAIVHELEHVRRGDWAVQLCARAVAAIYWFHPMVWTAWRRLVLEAERACDDAVLARHDGADYAEQLVSLASRLRATTFAPYLAMANRSDLSTRVSALLDEAQHRGRAGAASIAAAMAAVTLVVAGVAPLRAVAVEPGQSKAIVQNLAPLAAALPRTVRSIDRALLDAVDEGNLQTVANLIDAGANVNAVVLGDGSPLIVAARTKIAIARLLLDRGADPNLTVPGDGSPLIQAAARSTAEMAALLIERGADVNLAVPGDENALMNAARAGSLGIVKLLVQRGARVNERIWADLSGPDHSGEWRTALSQARRGGHDDVVAYLQSVGARE